MASFSDSPVPPVSQGDWVANLPGHGYRLGRVRCCYYDERDKKFFIDLILYDPSGDRIGRNSPPEGGPKTFEPWLTYTGEFRRIAPPSFPIERKSYRVPTKTPKGKKGPRHAVHFDYDTSVTVKAERTKRLKPKVRNTRRVIYIKEPDKNFDAKLESAALRRSAQELRDMAKHMLADNASVMLDRAKALEAEAAKFLFA